MLDINNFEDGTIIFLDGKQLTIYHQGDNILVENPDLTTSDFTKKEFEEKIKDGVIVFNKPSQMVMESKKEKSIYSILNEAIHKYLLLEPSPREDYTNILTLYNGGSVVKSELINLDGFMDLETEVREIAEDIFNIPTEDLEVRIAEDTISNDIDEEYEGSIFKAINKEHPYITMEKKITLLAELQRIAKEYPDVHIRQQALSFLNDLGMQSYENLDKIEKFVNKNSIETLKEDLEKVKDTITVKNQKVELSDEDSYWLDGVSFFLRLPAEGYLTDDDGTKFFLDCEYHEDMAEIFGEAFVFDASFVDEDEQVTEVLNLNDNTDYLSKEDKEKISKYITSLITKNDNENITEDVDIEVASDAMAFLWDACARFGYQKIEELNIHYSNIDDILADTDLEIDGEAKKYAQEVLNDLNTPLSEEELIDSDETDDIADEESEDEIMDLDETESDLVKAWYIKKYPKDELGKEIPENLTFDDIYNNIPKIYDLLAPADDSIIRERVFEKLAELKGVSYDDIYDKWLEIDESLNEEDDKFNYMMLDRLRTDCEYFLGNGNGYEPHLWAGNIEDQIAEMKKIYDKLPEKPEWLSLADINKYEKDMLEKRNSQKKDESLNEEMKKGDYFDKADELTRIVNVLESGQKEGYEPHYFGNWKLTTSLDNKWGTLTDNIKRFILREITFPVREGHTEMNDLNVIIGPFIQTLSKEDYKSLGIWSDEELENMFSNDGELETWISYNIVFDQVIEKE